MSDEFLGQFLRHPAFALKDGRVAVTVTSTDKLFGQSKVRRLIVVVPGLFQKSTVQRHRQMQSTRHAEE